MSVGMWRVVVSAVSVLVTGLVATPGAAQTPVLQAAVEDVLGVLLDAGVTDREALIAALQAAWDAEPEEEVARRANAASTGTPAGR
jgi:hypothetical protein